MDPEAQISQPLLEPAGSKAEHWSKGVARAAYSSLTHLAASLLFGLVTGICFKTIGQSIAIALVILFIAFQVLAYYGFVNINWLRLGSSLSAPITNDGKLDIKRVGATCGRVITWALSWGTLSILGFVGGFLLGWKVVGLL